MAYTIPQAFCQGPASARLPTRGQIQTSAPSARQSLHTLVRPRSAISASPSPSPAPTETSPTDSNPTQTNSSETIPSKRRAPRLRKYKASNGVEHLGTALMPRTKRQFPGPPPDEGPPLRVLPVGGLGEIGMNCMLVGVKDRYILIDAGLMFPDFAELGMQKILPDTSFLYQWRDKIEAVIITHGHEDHIGALPWVVPALDPSTPIYAGGFVLQLLQRRMMEFSLWDPTRFKQFQMKQPFEAGPFQITPVRVTHSIPDCCGLILKSDYGTIVHTGDWKIDDHPADGQGFDRETFDLLGKESIALMMSDSTNVLSPGYSTSEKTVEESLMRRVMGHAGKGRIVLTQFASNVHRLSAVKKAADAAGRKICFVGMSLIAYLEAAHKDGRAPMDPKELISKDDAENMDPNEVLIVTTGSQAEPRASLSLAAKEASPQLKILPSDLIIYSAKVIPGNETRVMKMLNDLSGLGAEVAFGASEKLHASGHAYQGELTEVLRYVKPQHFLPVHGEYAFLVKHAELAREVAGVRHVEVIRNGQMLGIRERPSGSHVSSGSMAQATLQTPDTSIITPDATSIIDHSGISVIGETNLTMFYNDGNKGTGTATEMAIDERVRLAYEGCIVAAVVVIRPPGGAGTLIRSSIRLTARGMWVDGGKLLREVEMSCVKVLGKVAGDAPLQEVERLLVSSVLKSCRRYNQRRPEVIVFAHEYDPRASHVSTLAQNRELQRSAMRQAYSPDGSDPESKASTSGRYPPPNARRTPGANPTAAPSGGAPFRRSPGSSDGSLNSKFQQGAKGARRMQQQSPPDVLLPPGSPPMGAVPEEVLRRRQENNPREMPNKENVDYGFD